MITSRIDKNGMQFCILTFMNLHFQVTPGNKRPAENTNTNKNFSKKRKFTGANEEIESDSDFEEE